MATFSISDTESLSYRRQYNFLGDIFCYNSTDFYTVSSRVRNVTGDPEKTIVQIYDKLKDKSELSLDYFNFNLNGFDLGSGKITSFDWEEGTDVLSKKYTMSFEVQSSGDLYNLTGVYYNDIDSQPFISGLKYVSDLRENIEISLAQKNVQEITQSLSFSLGKPLSDQEKNQIKNSIFSGFYVNRMPSGVGMNGPLIDVLTGQNSGHLSFYNEVVDTINGNYQFERKSSFDETNKKASWTYAHSVSLNGNNTAILENGTIKSNYFETNSSFRNLSGVRQRWNEDIKTGIFNRVTETFNKFSGISGLYPSGYKHELFPNPVQRTMNEDPLGGSISYSYEYTNDPTFHLNGYTFSNDRSASADEEGFFIISEKGEYRGISTNQTQRFANASGGFFSAGSIPINSRIDQTFVLARKVNPTLCSTNDSFKITNEKTTFQEYDGLVSYSKEYSNNPSYYPVNSNFVKYKNTISYKNPVHYWNKFIVPNNDEIIQSARQTKEGILTNNITIFGKRGLSIDAYFNEALTKIIKPEVSSLNGVYFLRDASYTFNPFTNNFNATFDYYYASTYIGSTNSIV